MNIARWTDSSFEVKFSPETITELPLIDEEYGFVKRIIGISEAVISKIGFANGVEALEQFRDIAIEGDIKAMEALERFFKTETQTQYLGLDRERYFPAVEFTLNLDNGVVEQVFIICNESADSVASWNRFIAIVLPSEMETYQLERTHIEKA